MAGRVPATPITRHGGSEKGEARPVPNDRGRRNEPGDDVCEWVDSDDLRYALSVTAAARRRTLSRSEARRR
jgi:hypothetical protein